jgi:hypothetical protein
VKKILIGAGIGCGALILIAVVALGALGYWAKGKVQNVTVAAEKMGKQSKELSALNTKYHFESPPEGEPIKLQKDRLEKYFAVRAALIPVYQRMEAKGKELEAKSKAHGGQASIGDSLKAGGILMDFTTEVRAAFIDGLEKQEMSPKEFQYTTMAIFSSEAGMHTSDLAKAEQQGAEQVVKGLEKTLKDPGLSAEQRTEIQQQLEQAKQNLAEANKGVAGSSGVTAVHTENAKLLADYKDQIKNETNPGLDALLFSGFEADDASGQDSE